MFLSCGSTAATQSYQKMSKIEFPESVTVTEIKGLFFV